MVHPEERERKQAKLLACLERDMEFRHHYRAVSGNAERYVDTRADYVRDDEGHAVGLLGVCRDVTEQVESERGLRDAIVAAQAAATAKANFLATMSHEIRTPMNGVIGMASLLVATELDPQQREYAETIRSSGESLLTIINDVLDFSKMEAGRLELERTPFDLSGCVTHALNLFTDAAEKKGVLLEHRLPARETYVAGDPTRFRQILLNLVSNALKFTEKGKVEVRVGARLGSDGRTYVEVVVQDSGIGMSPEHVAKLGEAFMQADASTTRKFGGTGLGISICKGLVGLMDGDLTVRSEIGKGTSFTVKLPFDSARPGQVQGKAEATSERGPKLTRVLVVEDNTVNQRVVVAMLGPFAEQVDIADNGRLGYDRFVQGNYDLVLMDGQMPELDGVEATRLIRTFESEQGRKRTPVVALTANALPGDREHFLAAGMDDYLSKPIRREDLAHLLERLQRASAS